MKFLSNNIKFCSLIIAVALLASCGDNNSSDPGSSDDDNGEDNANNYLNENINLPAGSFLVSSDQITESSSIEIQSDGTSGVTQVVDGQSLSVSIPFSDPNGTVTHAGIAFGDPDGDIWMIPIDGAQGNTSGTLNFTMQIPPSICDDLSGICHDIKCYEFAVSKDVNGNSFQISRSNINQLASACGACDEPSCTSLLGPNCGAAGGDGNPRFNLTWDNIDVDLDLYVIEPSGEEISYLNSVSSTGGTLDLDCACPPCLNGAAENIFWDNGPLGQYAYFVDYFGDCGEANTTANWTIRVFNDNRIVASKTGSLSSEGESTHYTYNQ